MDSSFASDPTVVFTVRDEETSRDGAILGTGLSAQISKKTRAYLDYDARLNSDESVQVLSGPCNTAGKSRISNSLPQFPFGAGYHQPAPLHFLSGPFDLASLQIPGSRSRPMKALLNQIRHDRTRKNASGGTFCELANLVAVTIYNRVL